MKMFNALVAVAALSSGVAMAGGKTPNCDVEGKKVNVKNEAACTKKKGTWMAKDAAAAAGTETPAPAADAHAPAAEAPAAEAPAK